MLPAEVYRLARGAGLTSKAAVVATSIAWAESGLNEHAIGDEDLTDRTWGPSCGLWQVRSLRADKGTGKERDADRLIERAFNARSMVAISKTGTDWMPWSVFVDGSYATHLAAVRAAVKEKPMDLWHPRCERVQPADGHNGLSMLAVPPKIVLHTTETDTYYPSTGSYYGNPYWPHATLVAGHIYQHLPIDAGAYALAHDSGTVDTNRANAIQCEIVWRAANPDWPKSLLDTVADWVGWVAAQTGAPLTFAEMWRAGVTVASVDSPIRFGEKEWLNYSGICGHSNVPGGNDHWDPGRLPVDRLAALLGSTPTPTPPNPTPTPHQEALTMNRQLVNKGADYLWLGAERIFTRITVGGVFDVLKAGNDVPRVEVDDQTLSSFQNWAKNGKFTG